MNKHTVAIALVATLAISSAASAADTDAGADAEAPSIVVSQAGGGDVETIAAAVTIARDGDIIGIRPGVYVEQLVVSRDIMLMGDGEVADIVLTAPAGHILRLIDSDAILSGFTLHGPETTGVDPRG